MKNILYLPPYGEPFEASLNSVFSQSKSTNNAMHIAGNFNLNLLDHYKSQKLHFFLNLIYQNDLILTVKLTYLPIYKFLFSTIFFTTEKKVKNIFTYKRTCNSECTKSFKQNLHEIEWIEIETLQNPNKAYKTVSQKVVTSFDNYFLERKIKMENKDSQIPTITREIKRSSKRNQSLNEKLFKKSKQAKQT